MQAQRILPGHPLGTFFGADFAGLNASGNQTFVRYDVTRDASGRELSRVANGVTTSPSFNDLVVIGNANPTYSLGATSDVQWKNFSASWLWRLEQGRDVFNNLALVSSNRSNVTQERNFLRSGLGTNELFGAPALYSSRWIEDGSFLRLQNVTVSYTIRTGARARGIRVYVTGDNLLLFTRYTGVDPEVFVDAGSSVRGMDYLAYPRARTIATGMRLQF